MKITKDYHFYSAHRNPAGGEKCGRIHGHTYYVTVTLEFQKTNSGGVCMLFQDIDKVVYPFIKSFDHWFLLWDKDPLVEILEKAGEEFKKVPFITSAENLAKYLFDQIENILELPVTMVTLKETTTSIVIYNGE